jgi:hypothetical protein
MSQPISIGYHVNNQGYVDGVKIGNHQLSGGEILADFDANHDGHVTPFEVVTANVSGNPVWAPATPVVLPHTTPIYPIMASATPIVLPHPTPIFSIMSPAIPIMFPHF